jgi:hypothetical protein
MYSGFIRLINTYSTLFTAIGGRDEMDAGGAHWMTCSINRSHHELWPSEFTDVVGDIGHIVLSQFTYHCSYCIYTSIPSFPVHQGRQE